MHVIGLWDEDSNSGNNKLFNVLLAYSNYDTELGYTQGTNFIVALLLFFLKDEEQVFWCYKSLMTKRDYRQYFIYNLAKVIELAKHFVEGLGN